MNIFLAQTVIAALQELHHQPPHSRCSSQTCTVLHEILGINW
jgi:hypothetical protein